MNTASSRLLQLLQLLVLRAAAKKLLLQTKSLNTM
jgi:hypothetical protein